LQALHLRPDDELIVVDSGSTDNTMEIAREFRARILQIRKDEFTFGGALNLGFGSARHEWALSLSSHTVPVHTDFLDRYRNAISNSNASVTAIVGPIVGEFENPIRGGLTFFSKGDLRYGFGFGVGNPNSLYRRAAWVRRPFDEHLGPAEDLRWYFAALEAGETIMAVHAAEVTYISQRPARAFYRKGREEYRWSSRLYEAYRPNFTGLIVRFTKAVVFVLIGRMSLRTGIGSMAYYLGMYAEERAIRRK
jgi:glycosyltransferase involved in cell wall biosynthesis